MGEREIDLSLLAISSLRIPVLIKLESQVILPCQQILSACLLCAMFCANPWILNTGCCKNGPFSSEEYTLMGKHIKQINSKVNTYLYIARRAME